MDLHYKIHPASDHLAKFHGDRPRELGDLVAKEKKNITGKTIRPSELTFRAAYLVYIRTYIRKFIMHSTVEQRLQNPRVEF